MSDGSPAFSPLKAGEGTRTLDILLGKQALYQLSYTRIEDQPLPPFHWLDAKSSNGILNEND